MTATLQYLLACALAVAAVCAQAGMGLTQIPGLRGDGPVTVYYPSSAAVMLSPLPPLAPGSIASALLADPPGFDRATALPALDRRVVAFFTRHLLP